MRRDPKHAHGRSNFSSTGKSGLEPRHTDGSSSNPRTVHSRGNPTQLAKSMESRAPDWGNTEMDQTRANELRSSRKTLDPAIQRSLRSNIAKLHRKGLATVRALRNESCRTAQEHQQQLSQLKQAQVIAYPILLCDCD